MLGLKRRRREKIRNRPFPHDWIETIRKNVPLYRRLPETDQKELQGHILVFLREKFRGLRRTGADDEIRVTIAAQACILLLHRKTDYYPELFSILVYPGAFIAKGYIELAPASIWKPSRYISGNPGSTARLFFPGTMFWPTPPTSTTATTWCSTSSPINWTSKTVGRTARLRCLTGRCMWRGPGYWAEDFLRLRHDAEEGLATVLDQYGATNPAELFAVATECFFEKPVQLQSKHPELYENLKLYFQQDPAGFAPREESE